MRKLIQFCLLLSILLLLNACAAIHGSSNRQGKLSEAMKEAACEENSNEDRGRSDEEEHHRRLEDHALVTVEITDTTATQPEDTSKTPIGIGFNISQGTIYSEDFSGIAGVDVSATFKEGDRFRVDINGGVHYGNLQKSSELNASISSGVVLLSAKVDFNYFTTPEYTFLGQYFFGGIGYNYMMWNYKNPVTYVEEDGSRSTIESDAVDGIEIYAGVGFNVIQTRTVHIGGELSPGVILWLSPTHHGYENDVFKPFTYLRLTFKFSFGNMRGN